jgi:uracil permease
MWLRHIYSGVKAILKNKEDVTMTKNQQLIGYLPDERPPVWRLFFYALQQVVVMFPATVAVAIITGFHISTTIFASGLATLCFILITKREIPLYYGSSFSYVAAISSLMASDALAGYTLNEKIAVAQFGIIMSGFVSIAAGLIIKRFGRDSIEKILPATITGPIAMVIGLTLAGNALRDAASISIDTAGTISVAESQLALAGNMAWIISLVTLISTILLFIISDRYSRTLSMILYFLISTPIMEISAITTSC